MVEFTALPDFEIWQEVYCIIAGAATFVIITDYQFRRYGWAYVVQTREGVTYEAWISDDDRNADLRLIKNTPIETGDRNISLPEGRYRSKRNNRPGLNYSS